jgi:SAM-dependent methyltransferase
VSGLVAWLDERLYPGFERNWDDRLFRARIEAHLGDGGLDLLDLGAGAGIVTQMDFRGRARRVCGIDPDPRVTANPHLDEGKVGIGESIPYPDASFDLVFADNVLEHLPEPQTVLAEVARVLRPGGVFLAKTPNATHYMPLIARLTPHGFHQWINRRRGRAADDTFPTRYLANTPSAIRRLAQAAGLGVEHIELIEGRPEYLRMTAPTYLLGWLYERAVNLTPALAGLRILMIVVLRKPGA